MTLSNIDDLQTFTSIDLNKKFYSKDEVNLLLKEFYKSDLIFDIEYYKENDIHNLIIQENKLVENIYINGNTRIEDEIILQNISIKRNGFLNKNYINLKNFQLIESI